MTAMTDVERRITVDPKATLVENSANIEFGLGSSVPLENPK